MTVADLLRVFAGETFLQQHWERIGKSFPSIHIREDLSVHPAVDLTNPYSFPEILSARVYHGSTSYTAIAKDLWKRIRLVNSTPDSLSSYLNKISLLNDHDFICWYHHRHVTRDGSFEDRVFSHDNEMLLLLKGPGGKSLVPRAKEMLKNDIEEEYHIPK
jgi:hypothetical protein